MHMNLLKINKAITIHKYIITAIFGIFFQKCIIMKINTVFCIKKKKYISVNIIKWFREIKSNSISTNPRFLTFLIALFKT